MLFIHRSYCVFPQSADDLDTLLPSRDNQLFVVEPGYPDIPPGLLRRMGKAVKISVGAALPLLRGSGAPDGIILGTGNGGLEDCIKFLDQIIQYDEGMLTPANFVQSTANAMASQISLLTRNKGYNCTHIHRGLAFEQALLDACLQVAEKPDRTFLVGGGDEISSYNNHIEALAGSFKAEPCSNTELYDSQTPGSLAGEGAALFRVGGARGAGGEAGAGAVGHVPGAGPAIVIEAIETMHTRDVAAVAERLGRFAAGAFAQPSAAPDLLLTGENGDIRLKPFYAAAEQALGLPVARFKHMSGEHPTASAIGLWLAVRALETGHLPAHMVKDASTAPPRRILLYNTYKGLQHSFILVSKVND
ncbi:MAG TPA: beta-ketoacyl synthase chain length factor [Dinghuibacter sp.]|uniref:beta-ketoacyl synthase chain length factor n=1 Tax=Dinghuibacter sp. TaxID=2024697 RepID=UPI002C1F86B3|nr:beta-ketoacyl synthase chain length factor [Dinghuibacter sp.]HTJ11412.1 beta-ketoacyl synthase chain length factor [Dinghuibacter sp.]